MKLLNPLIFILIMSKCKTDKHFSKMRELFLRDFFQEKNHIHFNFYGCTNQRQKYDFIKKQIGYATLQGTSFIKTVILLKRMNIYWLVSDAVSCNILPYLREVNKNEMFRTPFKHLILMLHTEYEYYMTFMKDYQILPMSEVIFAIYRSNEFILSLIYKIRSNGNVVKEKYGIWTIQDGLKEFLSNSPFSVRRRNFQKFPIKFGTVILKDKHIINSNFDDIPKTSDTFFQQEMPILYSLLQSVNATMEIIVYDNHGYGSINKSTGKISGDGLVRDLFDKKIDLSSSMFLTSERIQIFQPISPIDFWGAKFFLKNSALSSVKNIYILTLSESVWITIFVIIILFTTTFYITLKWESSIYSKNSTPRSTMSKVSVSDMFLLSFEALCQQGTFIETFKISGRLLLLLLLLLCMFIFVAYSANILVLLKSTANIRTLNDLLENKYEVGALNQTYVKHYFQNRKTDILRKLYMKKICPNNYFDETRGLEKVQQGNFAFFAPTVSSYTYFLKNFTNNDICALEEVSGYMNMKSYPSVPKSSGYTKIFKIWLLNLQERGIAKRSKVRVVTKPQCNNQGGNFQSVRIFDCLCVILVYIYGATLSAFVIIIEIVIKRYSI